jgi:hypothetical protein
LPTIPITVPGFADVASPTRQLAGSRNLLKGVFADAAVVVALLAVASAGFGAKEHGRLILRCWAAWPSSSGI